MNLWGTTLSGYHVEVSGWDASDKFFVENTTLTWSDVVGKKVLLRRRLRLGTLVFLRLLEYESSEGTFPVAHRIESVGQLDTRGLREITLAQLRPRKTERDHNNRRATTEARTQ